MSHPLTSWSHNGRRFLAMLAATVALTIALTLVGPTGVDIVGFEYARTAAGADEIINGWSRVDQLRGAFSLGLDYLYMPVYASMIALACLWGSQQISARAWWNLGQALGWALWVAALFDAAENAALLRLLLGPVSDTAAGLAAACATAKFGIIGVGVGFAAVSGVAWLTTRRTRETTET